MINIDEFSKIEMRIGEVLAVEKVPDTDKLLKLMVSFGEYGQRQIISGIALYFEDHQWLVGKHIGFVFNLEPRIVRGLESQGMILAGSSEEKFSPALFGDVPAGTLIK